MSLTSRDSELVQIMDAALADAARQSGDWLACRLGCTQCCHGAFAINALDVARLRSGMEALHETDPALAGEIERRSKFWIGEHGKDYPGDLLTGLLGESDEQRGRFEEFANKVACPALDPATGRCDVYAWRPMTCLVFMAREMLRDPYWPVHAAAALSEPATWPQQYLRAATPHSQSRAAGANSVPFSISDPGFLTLDRNCRTWSNTDKYPILLHPWCKSWPILRSERRPSEIRTPSFGEKWLPNSPEKAPSSRPLSPTASTSRSVT